MELSERSRKELQQILRKDYGAELTDSQVNTLGVSLLRLARLASNGDKVYEGRGLPLVKSGGRPGSSDLRASTALARGRDTRDEGFKS